MRDRELPVREEVARVCLCAFRGGQPTCRSLAADDELDFGAQATATMLTHATTMSTALRMNISLDLRTREA